MKINYDPKREELEMEFSEGIISKNEYYSLIEELDNAQYGYQSKYIDNDKTLEEYKLY